MIGNLGKDPDPRDVNGTKVCSFSLATNENYKDKAGNKQTKTEWHNITVWGALAENCAKYLKKGSQVYVEGKLTTRKWTDKNNVERYTTEVVAQTVQFLNTSGGGGREQPPHPAEAAAAGQPTSAQPPMQPQYSEDDIPF